MNTTRVSSLADLLAAHDLLDHTVDLVPDSPAHDPQVTGADSDSRFVRAGHIFVCKGAAFKPAYLESALQKGAVAYLCDAQHAQQLSQVAHGVPALVASDLRPAMALVALESWGHPDRQLQVVGITGTKGKSTTSYILRSVLDAGQPGHPRTGIIGSIQTFDGVESAESINTTPEPCDLWRHVSNTAASGLPYLVMEVSSQALKYNRVDGLGLDVAVFLNIGRDHISPLEHPTWEDYFASKLRIFRQAKVAVVNLGTDHLDEVLEAAKACQHTLTFSSQGHRRHGHDADVWCDHVDSGFGQNQFLVHTPSWEANVTLSMPGLFNVDNALAAIAVCEVLGIGADQVVRGLSQVSVPGRMELVPSSDGHVVGIVDFAHNAMSFSKFGPSVRKEFPGWRIISVFGATGDKAVERREELPVEAAKWSDHMVFTKDDPGHERVEDICAAMAKAAPQGASYEIVPNRAQAVQRAVDLAYQSQQKTVVCVLARGTESFEHQNGQLVPDALDADMLRAALAKHQG
ncbi:MAG: Mur ligase family protein [Atopobiaceae bacterium]